MASRTSPPPSAGALLLAAGRGVRLRPLTDDLPKPALPVLDVPLGTWGLAALERSAPPVVVNASHLADALAAALGITMDAETSPHERRPRIMVERPEPFGTGGTLRALRDQVGDRLVTWNADSLSDVDVEALLESHTSSGAAATIVVLRSGDGADFETDGGRVVELIDRRVENRAGSRFIGVAVYERETLDLLPDRAPLGATEGLLKPLIERGHLHAFEHDGYVLDVGTPARYLEANQDVLAGLAPDPPRPVPGEIIDVSGGRAYVGPRVEAPVESLRAGAILLAGSAVEPGAIVSRAVVWPGERVASGTTLEDAIWFGGRALQVAPLAPDG